MNEEQQLKLQAFLDGELPESEAREMAALTARDSEATALMAELRHTRQALKNFEPELKLPESREFYWSKIEREIQRQETAAESVPTVSLFAWLRRLLIPAGAVAALVLLTALFSLELGLIGTPRTGTEMSVADSGAFTYHDDANGTTLVWFSYPPER